MQSMIFRVVERGHSGSLEIKEFKSPNDLLRLHTQIGVDDYSTDLSLRGLPVFSDLVGPMSDGLGTVRYETPEVFETLTQEEWTAAEDKRRKRRNANAS